MPVALGKLVGRIIGAKEDCAWEVNGEDINMPSIVEFATPHGSILESGIVHLDAPSQELMLKLKDLEKIVLDQNEEIYAGKLTVEQYTGLSVESSPLSKNHRVIYNTLKSIKPLKMRWEPKEDITAYELALCLPFLIGEPAMPGQIDLSMPQLRHFDIIDPNTDNVDTQSK